MTIKKEDCWCKNTHIGLRYPRIIIRLVSETKLQ